MIVAHPMVLLSFVESKSGYHSYQHVGATDLSRPCRRQWLFVPHEATSAELALQVEGNFRGLAFVALSTGISLLHGLLGRSRTVSDCPPQSALMWGSFRLFYCLVVYLICDNSLCVGTYKNQLGDISFYLKNSYINIKFYYFFFYFEPFML